MKSKFPAKVLGVLTAAVAVLAVMAPIASAETPAPGYEQFKGCPSPKSEDAAVAGCVRSVVTGGHFKMGNKEVPISNPIELTGGFEPGLVNFTANSEGGLKPVKQEVPGGVIGLTGLDWLIKFLNVEQLKLYAVTELAGQPTLGFGDLTLPIKVHLINPVLGNTCYVGSNANPITLNLTTGTTNPPPPNEPISGSEPTFSEENGIFKFTDATYVDNSFAAPGANGCVLKLLGFLPVELNSVVNLASGLPSAAGTNETVQTLDIEVVESTVVYP